MFVCPSPSPLPPSLPLPVVVAAMLIFPQPPVTIIILLISSDFVKVSRVLVLFMSLAVLQLKVFFVLSQKAQSTPPRASVPSQTVRRWNFHPDCTIPRCEYHCVPYTFTVIHTVRFTVVRSILQSTDLLLFLNSLFALCTMSIALIRRRTSPLSLVPIVIILMVLHAAAICTVYTLQLQDDRRSVTNRGSLEMNNNACEFCQAAVNRGLITLSESQEV